MDPGDCQQLNAICRCVKLKLRRQHRNPADAKHANRNSRVYRLVHEEALGVGNVGKLCTCSVIAIDNEQVWNQTQLAP